MKEIISPVDTEDGLFHDGDPSTGTEGTVVSAKWLNPVQTAIIGNQQELASVLKEAGIKIDPSKQDQLLAAIKKITGTALDSYVKRGEFGIGGDTPILSSSGTLDIIKSSKTGIYAVNPGSADMPSTAAAYELDWTSTSSGRYGVLIAKALIDKGSVYDKTFRNSLRNGIWQGWVMFYDSVNKPTPPEIGAAKQTGDVNQKFWVQSAPGDTNSAVPVSLLNSELQKQATALISTVYPVGIVAWFAQNKNPNQLFPGTTWKYIGENRTVRLAKQDGTDLMQTGGADSVTLNNGNMPAHNHSFAADTSWFDYGSKWTSQEGLHAHNSGLELGVNCSAGSGPRSAQYLDHYTSSDGIHSHKVDIGGHSHSVSGTTGSSGGGAAFSIINAYVKLMGWYRSA
ncbi:hypothetical protein P9A06_04865 [Serratia marcescens]|uniref:phage baseplate protein n=1 Tax=Serratia marcescens TaxID=615 RepID=UPI0032048FF0